jgi:hypothetical protein
MVYAINRCLLTSYVTSSLPFRADVHSKYRVVVVVEMIVVSIFPSAPHDLERIIVLFSSQSHRTAFGSWPLISSSENVRSCTTHLIMFLFYETIFVVYANSLLATLNSRHALQAHGSTVRSVHVSDLEFDDTGN